MNENEEITKLMDNTIVSMVENVEALEAGSAQHTAAVDSLVKVYRARVDETKNAWDVTEKYEQLKEQKRDRWTRIGTSLLGMASSALLYVAWMAFEASGNIAPRALGDVMRDMKGFFKK